HAVEAKPLLEQVRKELDQDFQWMETLDRQVFQVHHEMARQISADVRGELEERYHFHLAIQQIHVKLLAQSQNVQATLGQLAGKRQLGQDEYQRVVAVLQQAHSGLERSLVTADKLHLPRLKNMTAGQALG